MPHPVGNFDELLARSLRSYNEMLARFLGGHSELLVRFLGSHSDLVPCFRVSCRIFLADRAERLGVSRRVLRADRVEQLFQFGFRRKEFTSASSGNTK